MSSKEKRRSDLEYACLEMQKYKKRRSFINPAFLRKAYQYTSAECKDETQEKLHEYDYLK